MLAGKAAVLRTLRGAEDSAMTVNTLAALAPAPVEGKYAAHLQEHLVTGCWPNGVVVGASLQLVTS